MLLLAAPPFRLVYFLLFCQLQFRFGWFIPKLFNSTHIFFICISTQWIPWFPFVFECWFSLLQIQTYPFVNQTSVNPRLPAYFFTALPLNYTLCDFYVLTLWIISLSFPFRVSYLYCLLIHLADFLCLLSFYHISRPGGISTHKWSKISRKGTDVFPFGL